MRKAPELSEATELALREVTELTSGYPIDIWESREHLRDLDSRYYGLDIPPAWDHEWGEMPPELFDRWVMMFWEFAQMTRHPSTARLSEDFGVTRGFVESLRAHVAREAKRKLPDNFVAVARRKQALSVQKVIDDSMAKALDDGGKMSDKSRVDYGKLALAAMKRQSELLGLDMPKDPTSISLTQIQGNSVQVGEEAARKFGVKDMNQLREIGNLIAARMAEVEMGDADVLDVEVVADE